MNRYQRGKIYSIRSDSTDEVYIGSTIQPLSERLRKHRVSYKLYKEGKRSDYVTSFKLLEHDNHYIELIELYPCTTKEELQRREGEIMRTTNNIVNRRIEGRTQKEHYDDNKEAILQYVKQYYQDNREAILQYKKQYREDNKEALLQKMKQYYQDNKETIQQKKKQYYQDNKEAIQQYKKQTATCECNTTYTLRHKAKHLRTAKHQAYEEANNLYINVLFGE